MPQCGILQSVTKSMPIQKDTDGVYYLSHASLAGDAHGFVPCSSTIFV